MPLKVLEIPHPCSQPWEHMSGDERLRFCQTCGLHVHNLSALTSEEARKLVSSTSGRLCVSFERTPDGRVRTLDYQRPLPKLDRGPFWIVIGVFAALLAGCADAFYVNRRPARVMGAVCPPRVAGATYPSTRPATTMPAQSAGETTARPDSQPSEPAEGVKK